MKTTTAVRNVGLWRMTFFAIMLFEWRNPNVLMPFGAIDIHLEIGPERNRPGMDRWFGYSQFEWVQDLHHWLGQDPVRANAVNNVGVVSGIAAAFGPELSVLLLRRSKSHDSARGLFPWILPALTFTCLYSIRFLASAASFTNHNYLFPLLMTITMWAAGGGNALHSNNCALAASTSAKAVLEESISNGDTKGPSSPSPAPVTKLEQAGIDDHDFILRTSCEQSCVTLRAQSALLYGFASLWKVTSKDWLDGRICRGIFLGLESSGANRGVPWSHIESQLFPNVFVFLAWSGLFLDASMFIVLVFLRPTSRFTTGIFLTCTLLFHSFTLFAMSQRIGYAFPYTCLAGIFVFMPIQTSSTTASTTKVRKHEEGGPEEEDERTPTLNCDASIMEWLCMYVTGDTANSEMGLVLPSRSRRYTTLLWVLFQVVLPLRMPFTSQFNFPYNLKSYRWSWTMMLHFHSQMILLEAPQMNPSKKLPLLLFYMSPTCFGKDDDMGDSAAIAPASRQSDEYMPRRAYMPGTEHPMQDDRTLPLLVFFQATERKNAMMTAFPSSFLHRVAYGVGRIIDGSVTPDACHHQGYPHQHRMGMHVTYFTRLNNHGPFARLVDPTVDLVSVTEAQRKRKWHEKLYDAFTDSMPPGYEYILQGVGSLREEAIESQKKYEQMHPEFDYYFLSDRAVCLSARPLWLRPLGYPMVIIPVKLPSGWKLKVKSQPQQQKQEQQVGNDGDGAGWQSKVLKLSEPLNVQAAALEIGAFTRRHSSTKKCGATTEEDLLIALVFPRASFLSPAE